MYLVILVITANMSSYTINNPLLRSFRSMMTEMIIVGKYGGHMFHNVLAFTRIWNMYTIASNILTLTAHVSASTAHMSIVMANISTLTARMSIVTAYTVNLNGICVNRNDMYVNFNGKYVNRNGIHGGEYVSLNGLNGIHINRNGICQDDVCISQHGSYCDQYGVSTSDRSTVHYMTYWASHIVLMWRIKPGPSSERANV